MHSIEKKILDNSCGNNKLPESIGIDFNDYLAADIVTYNLLRV